MPKQQSPPSCKPTAMRFDDGTTGSISIILGPMFSGKSTELLRRILRFQIAGRKCVVVKYSGDTRYTNKEELSTHDQSRCTAVSAKRLKDVIEVADMASVIGIDEGQFFPDCVEMAEMWANAGKTVIVAALDGTFERKPFQIFCDMLSLIPLAESVEKFSAVCQVCGNEAAFSKRLTNDTAECVIGGSETYMSVCRKCFHLPKPVKIKSFELLNSRSPSSLGKDHVDKDDRPVEFTQEFNCEDEGQDVVSPPLAKRARV